jgi:hypothetical protein
VKKSKSFPKLLSILVTLVIGGLGLSLYGRVSADQLTLRSLQISDSLPSVTATYNLSFVVNSNATLGSIDVLFCSNTPIIGTTCDTPAGLNVQTATIASQTGDTGFSVSLSSTPSDLLLTRSPTAASPTAVDYVLTGITNPSSTGPYYVRVTTYATADGSGGFTDYGGIAYQINDEVNISTTVPPFINICVGTTIEPYDCSTATGDYIDMGNFVPTSSSSASTQVLMATNAASGYSLWVSGDTLTSGNNIIPAMNSADISRPGVPQFGINLVANNTPAVGQNVIGSGDGIVAASYNQPDFYKYVSGDPIASASSPADFNLYTISYIVNIAKGQPPGVYATTLTYIAAGNF